MDPRNFYFCVTRDAQSVVKHFGKTTESLQRCPSVTLSPEKLGFCTKHGVLLYFRPRTNKTEKQNLVFIQHVNNTASSQLA